jgi:lysophospholipase L1-like esterase
MTLYNPFSGRDPEISRVGDLALEGEAGTPFEEGVNDIIRDVGPQYDVVLVEIFPLFDGRAEDLIAFDLIHPNDDGYALMADTVAAAMSEAGLPVSAN